jgi:hypothetical protein
MNSPFEPLNDDEVLYVSVGRVLMSNPTFKVVEFLDALAQAISDREEAWSEENEGWFGDGLECEALRFSSQGWQRGRVRIRLEFCPEEPRPKLLDSRRLSEARRVDSPSVSTPLEKPFQAERRYDDIFGEEDY